MAEKRTRKKADNTEYQDETEHVLHVLHELMETVTSPIVKACLEEAHEDIAYLTSCETPVTEVEEHSAVA